MNIYLDPRRIPELKQLTIEQRSSVTRRFFGAQYGTKAGLAGGAGFLFAFTLSSVLELSFWPELVAVVITCTFAGIAYHHYALKRLRPEIADYVFVHFGRRLV